MRVVFWGTYDTGKPRTRLLCSGMRAAGIDVEHIHIPIWEGIEDKTGVRGWRARAKIALRWVLSYPRLVWHLLRTPRPDLLLIGYPGIIDILIAAPIARARDVPVAWDVFISMYDTICEDRNLVRRDGLIGRMLYRLERFALHRADMLFMDTRAHARRLERLFALPDDCCGTVWVGVESGHFPAQAPRSSGAAMMRVLFYGQFIPLHGVETIVAAARLLRDAPVRWHLIGRGQESECVRRMLDEQPLSNVEWTEWVEYPELHRRISEADLCLGIFGTSEKAASVIPNKVFQILAAQRPLVTRDGPAIRELLSPSPPCTWLVRAGDPDALADTIMAHRQALLEQGPPIGCHSALQRRIDEAAIGQQFLALAQRALDNRL